MLGWQIRVRAAPTWTVNSSVHEVNANDPVIDRFSEICWSKMMFSLPYGDCVNSTAYSPWPPASLTLPMFVMVSDGGRGSGSNDMLVDLILFPDTLCRS